MKRRIYLGSVFAIPTIKNEYLTGIVVREEGNILLCYFFGTLYRKIPKQDEVENIINDDILYVKQVSNMGLKDNEWKVIAKLDRIDKEKWDIPIFKKQDILTKKYYAVTVNEDLDEVSQKQITEEESKNMYNTGTAGSVFIEKFLSKLVY